MDCKEGIVEEVLGASILVRLVRSSACSGCHAKGACTSSDSKELVLNIEDYPATISVGDRVRIVYSETMGMHAVLLAFVLPLLLIISCAVVLSSYEVGEIVIIGVVLGLIVLYYGGLALFRPSLGRNFRLKALPLDYE